jgi:hypothetical protein
VSVAVLGDILVLMRKNLAIVSPSVELKPCSPASLGTLVSKDDDENVATGELDFSLPWSIIQEVCRT